MRLRELDVPGVWLVEGRPEQDERGTFVRHFDREVFAGAGLCTAWDQGSSSLNRRAGTLRGMHWQAAPHEETKLVRCVHGAIHDVVLDLRDGPTYGRWAAVELDEDDARALYIPPGCAHGFQTQRDDSVVSYLIATPYVEGLARGVRWDDPAFAIAWPPPPPGGLIISERDRTHPLVGG